MSKDPKNCEDGINVYGDNIKGLRQVMKRKIQRLCRLIDLDAPMFILTMEITSLFRTAVGLDPDNMGKHFMRWMARGTRRSYGMCCELDCDNTLEERPDLPANDPYFYSGMCLECWTLLGQNEDAKNEDHDEEKQ